MVVRKGNHFLCNKSSLDLEKKDINYLEFLESVF